MARDIVGRALWRDAVVITVDVDWASDPAIDEVARQLLAAGVRSTWFVTHASPAIDRLRGRPDLFELALHPNFLPGSTHGSDAEEVIAHCRRLVPEARAVRTHGLAQSSLLINRLTELAFAADLSIFLPHHPGVVPLDHWHAGRRLVRLPYIWEDDVEGERPEPVWDVTALLSRPGLHVLDFHPIHVCLNDPGPTAYRRLKQRCPKIGDATAADIADFRRDGIGPASMLRSAIAHLAATGRSWRVSDILAEMPGSNRSGSPR